jgi:hypothetical protein
VIELVHILNVVLTRAFDIVYWPIRNLSPFWSMTVISLLAGVVMVWIFGRVSNQSAIKAIHSQIQANLLAIRLFQDNLGVFFRVQGRVFKYTAMYMAYSLVPMLIMMAPICLLLVQLNLRYAVRPFQPGEAGLVEMTLAADAPALPANSVTLQASSGLSLDAGPVRIPEKKMISWRVRALEPGRHTIRLLVGTNVVEQTVLAGVSTAAIPTHRTSRNVLDLLLYPGEPPIPRLLGMDSIRIQYPELKIEMLGWRIPWLIHFMVASIIFGFAFKKPLKVEI